MNHGRWKAYTLCDGCLLSTGLPKSRAARLADIQDMLLGLPFHDDDGNVIGRGPPLITEEQARAALEGL